MLDFDLWTDRWLGKTVKVKLFGTWRTGTVIEAMDTTCNQMACIVELYDGNKQIKVNASIQALRRI